MSGKTKSVDFTYLGDKKLEKGKKELLEDEKRWKGGSHKERQEQRDTQKKIKKVMGKHARSNDEKISWKKKAMGIGAVVFMCGVGLMSFLSTVIGFIMGDGVTWVDVKNTAKVKELLFGGQPYLVYCVDNKTQNDRLPKVLEDGSRDLYSRTGMAVAVLHCWETTQSGRSVAQRFKLRTSPPLAFAVANGNSPRTVNLVGTSTAEELAKKVKPVLAIETYSINALKKWPTYCTSRRTCIVVGHKNNAQRDTALNVVKPLMSKYRAAKFVTLDTSFWQLKLDESLIAMRPRGQGGADVVCLARADVAEGNSTHMGSFLESLSSSAASSFVDACDKQTGLVRLKTTPKIKARPSKPKKVSAPSPPSYRPRPPPPRPPPAKTTGKKVDYVGSREQMETEDEPLFEAVEEGEEDADEDGSDNEEAEDESDEGGEEVEL